MSGPKLRPNASPTHARISTPLAKVRGKHRYQVLLRAKDHAPLHRLGRALQAAHDVAGVELAIDVDPVALL